MAYSNIPAEAYNDSFLFDGVSYDPVKFVGRLDIAMDAHRIEGRSHKSNVCQIPSERSEDTFEFDGHTYKHIAEHSGYTTSDVLLCDGVPNVRAWQKVINQVTAAKPGLFPLHLRPAPGLSFAEYDGGMGPVSVVEKNLDSLSDALGKFAALHDYPEGTPVDDKQLMHEFANAAIPTMHEHVRDILNEKYPGEAETNLQGDLCLSQNLIRDADNSHATDVFFHSAAAGMEKFAEKVGEEYEKAVENGDITPANDLER